MDKNPASLKDPSGEFSPQLVAAGIGAGLGAIYGAIAAGNHGGWTSSNAGNILWGAGVGLVTGATAGFGFGNGLSAAAAGGVVGAIAGFTGNVAGQLATGRSLACIDWTQATFQGGVGLTTGILAGLAVAGPLPVINPIVNGAIASSSLTGIANALVSTGMGGLGLLPVVKAANDP